MYIYIIYYNHMLRVKTSKHIETLYLRNARPLNHAFPSSSAAVMVSTGRLITLDLPSGNSQEIG